ncbi:unnamed protein product [Jaminaea pallidilutea]
MKRTQVKRFHLSLVTTRFQDSGTSQYVVEQFCSKENWHRRRLAVAKTFRGSEDTYGCQLCRRFQNCNSQDMAARWCQGFYQGLIPWVTCYSSRAFAGPRLKETLTLASTRSR